MKHKNDSPIVSYTLYNKRKRNTWLKIEAFFDSEWLLTFILFSFFFCLCSVTHTGHLLKPFKLGDILRIFKQKYSHTRTAAGKYQSLQSHRVCVLESVCAFLLLCTFNLFSIFYKSNFNCSSAHLSLTKTLTLYLSGHGLLWQSCSKDMLRYFLWPSECALNLQVLNNVGEMYNQIALPKNQELLAFDTYACSEKEDIVLYVWAVCRHARVDIPGLSTI